MKRDVQDRIKKTLAKNHACYVLITCDQPSIGGNMEVQMSYEETLRSHLIFCKAHKQLSKKMKPFKINFSK